MNNALDGVHVLVTRPAQQADNLCRLIEQQGGIAVRFPVLEIVAVDEPSRATNPLSGRSNFQWLIFTSANAVNFALKAIGGKIAQPEGSQIAAIGKATARELQAAGLTVDLVPKGGIDSEALLAMPQLQQVKGKGILIVKGRGGREELADGLRSRGAHVDFWEVYERIMPSVDNKAVLSLFENNKLGVIVITSCEALQNLMKMIGVAHHFCLVAIPLVVISERISRLATEIGFVNIAVAENPSDTAILDATITIINKPVIARN